MNRPIIEAALRIAEEHPAVAHLVDGLVESVTTNPPPTDEDVGQILADFFGAYSVDRCMADYRNAGIILTEEIQAEIDDIVAASQLVVSNINRFLIEN